MRNDAIGGIVCCILGLTLVVLSSLYLVDRATASEVHSKGVIVRAVDHASPTASWWAEVRGPDGSFYYRCGENFYYELDGKGWFFFDATYYRGRLTGWVYSPVLHRRNRWGNP